MENSMSSPTTNAVSSPTEVIQLPNGFSIKRTKKRWSIKHDERYDVETLEIPMEITQYIKPGDHISLRNTFMNHKSLKTIIFPEFFKTYLITDLNGTFKNCPNLNSSMFLRNANTTNCTECIATFEGCASIQSAGGVPDCKLHACTSLRNMFSHSGIKALGFLKNMKVSTNLIDISFMFSDCMNLVDVSGFNEMVPKASPNVDVSWVFKNCHNAIQSMQMTPLTATVHHPKHNNIKLYASPPEITPKFEYKIHTIRPGVQQRASITPSIRTKTLRNNLNESAMLFDQSISRTGYSPTYGDYNPHTNMLIGNDMFYQRPPVKLSHNAEDGAIYNSMRMNPMESPEYKALMEQLEQLKAKCNGLEYSLSEANRKNEELSIRLEKQAVNTISINEHSNIIIDENSIGVCARGVLNYLNSTTDEDDYKWKVVKTRMEELIKLNGHI